MQDELQIVQFPHPGSEHHPKATWMDWNRGEHARKFLVAHGASFSNGVREDGRLAFWGEWEPQSRAEPLRASAPSAPHWAHTAYWRALRHRRLLQNTDPMVFGDRFLYSNCRQLHNEKLRALAPGSLVLFGSKLEGEFVLDTVFVVGSSSERYTRGSAGTIATAEWLRTVVFEPLDDFRHPPSETFRLYRGVTDREVPTGPFSFVPCTRWNLDSTSGFRRPAIRLNARLLSPNLALGAKASTASPNDVRRAWEAVVEQVLAAGLLLGVWLAAPRPLPESVEAR